MKKIWKRICAVGLSTAMAVGLLQAAPGVAAYANEEADQEFAELEAFFAETQKVVYSALYIPGEKRIRVICDEEDLAGFDCYVRRDDRLEFAFAGHSNTRAFDIPVDSAEGYYDIRLVAGYHTGKEKTSGLLSMHLTVDGYEFVSRDSDGDGIEDGIEIWDYHTDPFLADTDGDGFTDGFEVYVLESDPLKKTKDKDSDGDGLSDLEEQEKGTNPYLPDSDFDGLSDAVDPEPLVADPDSGYLVDYSIKINQSNRDKKFKFKNRDKDKTKYEVLYNRSTGNVKHMQIGKDKEVWMFMNASNHLSVMVSRFGDEISADTYAYEDGYLSAVCHGGTVWRYRYDEEGNVIQTKIGERIICSNEYENGIAQKTIYGNGQENEYLYAKNSEFMEAVRVNGILSYQNQYDDLGNVVRTQDFVNGICYEVDYDEYGSIVSVNADNGFQIQYDSQGAVDKTVYRLADAGTKESIISETEEGTRVVYSDGTVLDMVMDEQMRVGYRVKNAAGMEVVGYEGVAEDGGVRVTYADGKEYFYRIGGDGRLQGILENGDVLVSYEYDGKGQLIRSDIRENGETVLYHYDADYNLICAEHYAFTLDTPQQQLSTENYRYGDKDWTALLTEYNGQSIQYDEIGNPVQYLGARLGWDNGRLLASFDRGDTHAEYQYDSQGIRIGKTVNGVKTNYFLDDKKLVAEKTGDEVIWYSYDSTGSPVSFEYQGTTYYYQKNIYNDVVGIADGGGNVLAEYSYDEWGSITDIRGNQELARANKMRYRSYFYDEETGFYYLQSRYYDAQTGRFLNADEKFVTFNLFAYCGNDPVNYVDYTGHDAVVAGYICIGLLFATIVLLVAFFQQSDFISKWQEFIKPAKDQLLTAFSSTIIYVGEQAQNVINDVARRLREIKTYVGTKVRAYTAAPTFKSPTEVHHIVAQNAAAADPARQILDMKDVKIDINDPANLVTIKTGVHQHLHTSLYYTTINLIVCSTYKQGRSDNKFRIEKKLLAVQGFLRTISNASPF